MINGVKCGRRGKGGGGVCKILEGCTTIICPHRVSAYISLNMMQGIYTFLENDGNSKMSQSAQTVEESLSMALGKVRGRFNI